MKRIIFVLISLFACYSVSFSNNCVLKSKKVSVSEHGKFKKRIKKYDVYHVDWRNAVSQLGKGGSLMIDLDSKNKWEFSLQENSVMSANCRIEVEGQSGRHSYNYRPKMYKGKTSDGRDVRLTYGNNTFSVAILNDDNSAVYIKSSNQIEKNESENALVVYESSQIISDSIIDAAPITLDPVSSVSKNRLKAVGAVGSAESAECGYLMELMTDADYVFYTKHNCSVDDEITAILAYYNEIEPIYESYFNMKFCINYMHFWTSNSTSDYPYNYTPLTQYNYDGTQDSPYTFHDSFTNYWEKKKKEQSLKYDTGVLFTGISTFRTTVYIFGNNYSFSGIVGLANLNSPSSVGLTSYLFVSCSDDVAAPKILAHETGHILGADDQYYNDSDPACKNTIMYSGTKNDYVFCETSLNEMYKVLAKAGSVWGYVSDIVVSENLSGAATQKMASNSVVGSAGVTNKSNVKFAAGNYISLKPGFHVGGSSNFKAELFECKNNSGGNKAIDIEEEEESADYPVAVISPNPTTGRFSVDLAEQSGSIRIYDTQGRVVGIYDNVEGNVECDLSDKPAGLYIIEVKTLIYTIVRKVVKQ